MRFPTRFFLGLLAVACLAVPALPANAGGYEDALFKRQIPVSVNVPEGGASVPLMTASTHPTVMVTIKGRPYRFQIETGAWFNTVSSRVARELNLPYGGNGEAVVEGLKVGDAEFGTLHADVADHVPGGVDGQLGLPAFADLLLTVDFPHHQLRLNKGTLGAANGHDILPLTAIGPLWGVPVMIGGKPFTGFIDTQSGDGLAMAPQLARTVSFATRPVAAGYVHGPAIGEARVTTAKLAGELAFGDYHIRRPTVASFPLEIRFPNFGVLMGPPMLSQFVLTLDQKHRLARFAPDDVEQPGAPVTVAAAR
jgi:hypothetical protein